MKITKILLAAAAIPAFSLSGCYIVPVGPDDNTRVYVPSPIPWGPPPPRASAKPEAPAVLQARLYPVNGVATRTGMVDGTCEYQMHTPYQGVGSCTFSNGARYQVQIGN